MYKRKYHNLIDSIDWLIYKNNTFIIFIRRLFLVIIDFLILSNSFSITKLIIYGELNGSVKTNYLLSFLIIPLGFFIYLFSGQYKGLARYEGSRAVYLILIRNGFLISILYFIDSIFSLNIILPKELILLWMTLVGLNIFTRFALRDLLINILKFNSNKKRIIIYGAGSAGILLASNLIESRGYIIRCFVDDNKNLWGRYIKGIKIESPYKISELVQGLDEIYLAIPSLKLIQRRGILLRLKKLNIPISEIPSIEEITSGKLEINHLRSLKIEQLLEREELVSNLNELSNIFEESVILITGAGGSIGSEICRQLISIKVKRLIMLDNSENNLYQINLEAEKISDSNVELIPILGNACDSFFIESILKQYKVDIVYHAAAYKHVPLVEANPIQGLENNVFSTMSICRASREAKIKKFILVSTDKSVRPTNIMGASKRLAELIVLANAEEVNLENLDNVNKTKFSMVRFGNVLNSSGSVVPLFLNQIAEGGPITLTHPDIIRYFMTIPEAAQLVLQASVFSKGGEVFLLDMGAPVRIIDLARKLINLNSLTEKNSNNPDGDIEIQIKGLRPGEKLYEEMLISDNSEKTENPLIFKAKEQFIKAKDLWPEIDLLKSAIDNKNINTSLSTLKKLVPEWKSSQKKNNKDFLNQ